MSRKTEKFYIFAASRSGPSRGKRLLGVNPTYEGGIDNITLQDLVDFLNEKGIALSKVSLPRSFITLADAR